MRRFTLLFALAALAGVLLVGGRVLLSGAAGPCPSPRTAACLRILFIGNSYTSTNDLPGQFAALARAGGHALETAMVAPGGVTLEDHAHAAETTARLEAGGWDVVVLQDQSSLPVDGTYRQSRMEPAVLDLSARARAARIVLFETWAHRDGYPEAGIPGYGAGQRAIATAYRDVASTFHFALAPVGDAWSDAVTALAGIDLWQPDGSHPTPAGTYLAACVLYATIYDADPVGLGAGIGIPSAQASALAAVVERTVARGRGDVGSP